MKISEYRELCMSRARADDNNRLKEYFKEMQGITWAMNAGFKKPKYIVPIVYSFYSGEKCLYIGSTECLSDRMDWHMRKKYWNTIGKIGIRVYKSRIDMRIAEMIHIFYEKPIMNNDAKYRDDKEMLFFTADGDWIKYHDWTEEAVFEKGEFEDFLKHGEWSLII